jgi:ABC-type sugar transport system ATPase subunit
MLLARWLITEPQLFILDEPTRGIDVGAKSEIYNLIFKLASEGVGVLVVSSDLPEVLGLADRLLVMRQGKLSAEFNRPEFNPELILAAALPVETSTAA